MLLPIAGVHRHISNSIAPVKEFIAEDRFSRLRTAYGILYQTTAREI
jgi:hypothetical protein